MIHPHSFFNQNIISFSFSRFLAFPNLDPIIISCFYFKVGSYFIQIYTCIMRTHLICRKQNRNFIILIFCDNLLKLYLFFFWSGIFFTVARSSVQIATLLLHRIYLTFATPLVLVFMILIIRNGIGDPQRVDKISVNQWFIQLFMNFAFDQNETFRRRILSKVFIRITLCGFLSLQFHL